MERIVRTSDLRPAARSPTQLPLPEPIRKRERLEKLRRLMDLARQDATSNQGKANYSRAVIAATEILRENGKDPQLLLAAYRLIKDDPMEERTRKTAVRGGLDDRTIVETRFVSPDNETMLCIREAYHDRLIDHLAELMK